MILDFAMPGLTGADVAEAARAGRPDLPIIIASGHLDTAALSAVPGDPTPVLRKPFRLERLHGLVTQMLKASEEAAERPEPPNAP
jgi:DNA-binding NtrC family response regulator